MRINPVVQQMQAMLLAAGAADARFRTTGKAPPPAADAPTRQPPPSLSPATAVQLLVAVAASAEPAETRRRHEARPLARGVALLHRFHAAAVGGAAPPALLREMVDWTTTFELPDDPVLASLARDIELRVRVELARHERIA